MDIIIAFFKTLPQLIATNKKGLINIAIVIFATLLINLGSIVDYLTKKDIVKEYTKRAFQIETSLKVFQKTYQLDALNIAILHNGVVSIVDPNFHLMKFSILFSVGENSRTNKALYVNQPLSVWIDNINAMVTQGKFVILDSKSNPDPLIREMYKSHHMSTQVYLPMFKDGLLIGFAIASYKDKRDVTPLLIHQMKRNLQNIEARL